MSRLLREPLVHFLILGALLFAVFGVAGGGGGVDDRSIVVTRADVERIEATWLRQWGRPPSASETAHLVEQFVREEVLYREALGMGLQEGDAIVRRRLVQKIEFLSEDLAVPSEPEMKDLREFFESEIDRYLLPARASFTHVYLSRDRRGDKVADDASRLLVELRREGAARAHARGDRFMLQYDFALKSESEIGRDFGAAFGAAVLQLDVGGWQGPIESGYGLHLVRLSERVAARQPELEEVLRRVRNDFVTQRRRDVNEAFYAELRSGYRIVLEEAPLASE